MCLMDEKKDWWIKDSRTRQPLVRIYTLSGTDVSVIVPTGPHCRADYQWSVRTNCTANKEEGHTEQDGPSVMAPAPALGLSKAADPETLLIPTTYESTIISPGKNSN